MNLIALQFSILFTVEPLIKGIFDDLLSVYADLAGLPADNIFTVLSDISSWRSLLDSCGRRKLGLSGTKKSTILAWLLTTK